ncbi:MAG TPA: Rieske 2Fe-2S domain-containing protein [Beijerinckiaceae bacterium]|nr:Rieske 2Fe-2S domain-containing protein [Beijerinckiaceae bacterium]
MTNGETLTRVGPGTPMGRLMRQYWVPALLSSEAIADGPPIRLRLLGEDLLAFRDTSGNVGVVEHQCAHRCASLFFGRNEENGIRCVYHGWKFDTNGRCLDAPNLPDDSSYREKVRIRAYATREHLGIVWAYMGDSKDPPDLPKAPALGLDANDVSVWCALRPCNYLQALEGDIDTSHLGFLHGGKVEGDDPAVANRAPEYHVTDTECGVMYAAYRDTPTGDRNWRFGQFNLPFFTQPPPVPLGQEPALRAFVPMDDTHTMFFSITSKAHTLSAIDNPAKKTLLGGGPGISFLYDYLPNTTDWYGRWRLKQNIDNDYLIDREVQKHLSYSGIEGVEIQDMAISESMGPIVDRDREHLAPSDIMVVRTRRCLLRAAKELMEQGKVPPSAQNPDAYRRAWGGFANSSTDKNWLEVFEEAVMPAEMRADRPLPAV